MVLFTDTELTEIAPGAVLIRNAIGDLDEQLLREVSHLAAVAPFRRVITPTGKAMSVEMTNCGAVGWISDRSGYRYEENDPISGRSWPSMPAIFCNTATQLATRVGYPAYSPDTCLINKYSVGSKMGMHQDRDERDFRQPIVSVSLGLPIMFKFGGTSRTGPSVKVRLTHGDVIVFGGVGRLAFHGVGTLRAGSHPLTGACRYNLTFRVAR